MLEHGGKLRRAAAQYGIPLVHWLDVSTGINPYGWRVPDIPPIVWQRLPEDDDGLERAAIAYYGAHHALPVAGSQAAIQLLPKLRTPGRVAILAPTYAEHAHAWRKAGHEVIETPWDNLEESVRSCDVVLVVNPNAPTGHRFNPQQLLQWHNELARRDGWLIVDEAFMDVTPEQSVASFSDRSGLIVLRSLGKFFGLAGARVGFVLAEPSLLRRLKQQLGPWSVAGPARFVATRALEDTVWQADMRKQLIEESQRLAQLLAKYSLEPQGGTALFQSLTHLRAEFIHEALAAQGVYTRLFPEYSRLRFGLPGGAAQWQQLTQALANLKT